MLLTDLHSAAASADLARLRQRWWLNKHRINAYNRDKQTPLHLACINGHADVVGFLVEKKCKLNRRDKMNKSPLMKAVEHQHKDCAAILLEHGADPNRRGVSGNTALHFAVMVSSKSLVELLLEHGADINAKNELGYTPLTLAVTENCEEMVKFLLQKGADVNAQDNALSERIGSSCSETPVIPLETSALAESCDESKEEATEEEDSVAAADQNKVSVHTSRVQTYRDYKEEGLEKKEDKCPIGNPETDPKGRGKLWTSEWLPAANSNRLDARSAAVECGKGVLPAASVEAEEEDDDLSWGSEDISDLLDQMMSPVQRPAGKCSRVGMRSAAEERGKATTSSNLFGSDCNNVRPQQMS
ncbi:uncharacterized protein M8220_017210 [Acridotheres tristis]